MKIDRKTKVILEGRGTLTLRPNDHEATGGEGSVYIKGDTALKLYQDPRQKMGWNRIPEKIAFFQKSKNQYIVAPEGIVTDKSGNALGYYMPYIRDFNHGGNAEPIARIFTNACRQRLNFTDDQANILVARMQEIIQFAHQNKAIVVDANELGYFVIPQGKQGPEPRMIDVDCWVINNQQPPVLPIMPSIRDWHSQETWGVEQDWFAWAIVTFQVYTGIHPYKGKLPGYKPIEMERRMKENASVFSRGVRLNRAVRDFSKIPGPLLDWYVNTFQKGQRTVPPSPFDTGAPTAQVAQIQYVTTTTTGLLYFDKLYQHIQSKAVRIFPSGIIMTEARTLIKLTNQQVIGSAQSNRCEIVRVQDGWLKADIQKRKLKMSYIAQNNLQETSLDLTMAGTQLVRYENRMFIVAEKGLTEMILKIIGKPILTIGQTWGAMSKTTKWFNGVGVQNIMGATYLTAPFGEKACAQIRVKELDGLTSINARAGNRFITIIAFDKKGVYKKFELVFDRNYSIYKLWQGETDSLDLNVAILPKGVCATIVNDGDLDIFVPTTATLNKVQDKHIATDMALANWDDKVVYIKNGEVWQVRMR
jgi:hypothetical protein